MEQEKKYAETYGGKLGGILPLAGMIITIIILCMVGMGSLQNFWGAGFLAIALGLIVYKNKNRYAKAVMKGFANPSFTMLFPIFIAAGILSQILTAVHLVDGLVYLVSLVNIPPAIIPCVTFVVCAIMSTVTGSSAAALLATMPMLFPMGVQMGCPAGLVLGAICSGSEFGNNLSHTYISNLHADQISSDYFFFQIPRLIVVVWSANHFYLIREFFLFLLSTSL